MRVFQTRNVDRELKDGVEEFLKAGLTRKTDRARNNLSAFDAQKRRNSLNLVLHRNATIVVDVHFHDTDLASIFCSKFLKYRRDLTTRTTPRCPKVHDDRKIALKNVFFKGGVSRINNFCGHVALQNATNERYVLGKM